MSVEYVQSIEIDVDYCENTYGNNPCNAFLGSLQNSLIENGGPNFVNLNGWVGNDTGALSVVDGNLRVARIDPSVTLGIDLARYQMTTVIGVEYQIDISSIFRIADTVNDDVHLSYGVDGVELGSGTNRVVLGYDVSEINTLNFTATSTSHYFSCGVRGGGSNKVITLISASFKERKATPDHKCFNTFKTCQDTNNFIKEVKTVSFFNNTKMPLTAGVVRFPFLNSVSFRSSAVNISGASSNMKGLGIRATVTAVLSDAPYSDSFFDKYYAERLSGVAQTDEGAYDPFTRGTVFAKLRARWPYYAGRPMRIVSGKIEDGVYSIETTRHYIITDFEGPDQNGRFVIKGKDVLDLADDKRAVVPKLSEGSLALDITDVQTTFNLTPSGVGSTYPSSGWLSIGSEAMAFTRVNDAITITQRGDRGTEKTSHDALDTVQEVFSVRGERIDAVIRRILVDEAGIPASFIPDAKWTAECDRWSPTLLLTSDILEPTGANGLLGELALLGVSIWWDDVLQEIGLKINRPVDNDIIHTFSDEANLYNFDQKDKDEDRITQVAFYSVQNDPSESPEEPENFKRQRRTVDTPSESENQYNDTRLKRVFSRWINNGNDTLIAILNLRTINRFKQSPTEYKMEVLKDENVALTDVLEVTTRAIQDATGKSVSKRMQVYKIQENRKASRVTVFAQSYQFDIRYGGFADNARGVYGVSSDAEKLTGTYFATNGSKEIGEGEKPYVFI